MSKTKLPQINAIEVQSVRAWQLRDDTLMRWNNALKASDNDRPTIDILEPIGEDLFDEGITAKSVHSKLRAFAGQDIEVNVNSPGGNFFHGVAIYNLLREHNGKVTVRIMGVAASAASVIAMAGDEILIAESGFLMIHNAWVVAIGDRHDMADANSRLEPFDQAMAELYAKRSGKDIETVSAWMDKTTWFNGADAIDEGLATGYLPSDEIDEDAETRARLEEFRAGARIENALRAQNPELSRSERRALLAQMKGGKPSAAAPVTLRADVELLTGLRQLSETLKH